MLYATSARLGGSGLDAVALESLRVAHRAGSLGRVLTFENRQTEIPSAHIQSLRWHPVRLLSGLGREYYYGAKKHALDRAAAQELARSFPPGQRPYDLFHTWSGECLRSLTEAQRQGVPSVIEIPTWHRHKGKSKPDRLTQSERERAAARGWQGWKNRLLITRQQVVKEYDLADLILVLSEKAEETFLEAGIAPEKLFRHQRGVDTDRFSPSPSPPDKFVALFVGALIRRKGVHHLLEVWHRLNLPNAELLLVGSIHDEIRPALTQFAHPSVRLPGFVDRVEDLYRQSTVHILPSECEGSAKCTYEAAASGLPQITTRESGDVVQDGLNGLIIPPNDPDALATAILHLYHHRDLASRYGIAGRERVLQNFTWEHFRIRLAEAYSVALSRSRR